LLAQSSATKIAIREVGLVPSSVVRSPTEQEVSQKLLERYESAKACPEHESEEERGLTESFYVFSKLKSQAYSPPTARSSDREYPHRCNDRSARPSEDDGGSVSLSDRKKLH